MTAFCKCRHEKIEHIFDSSEYVKAPCIECGCDDYDEDPTKKENFGNRILRISQEQNVSIGAAARAASITRRLMRRCRDVVRINILLKGEKMMLPICACGHWSNQHGHWSNQHGEMLMKCRVVNCDCIKFDQHEETKEEKLDSEFSRLSELDSNLIRHAVKELETIGEEKSVIVGYLKMIEVFVEMGHSGGSASVFIPTLTSLLNFTNLKPLTNNPDEWTCHSEEVSGVRDGLWQSKRNGEAFSLDGGKTYYLLSEGHPAKGDAVWHTAEDFNKEKTE